MAEFTTPGRRSMPSVAGGGSSGRRVVRSALELLADTASPDLFRQNGEKHVLSENPKSKESTQKLTHEAKTAFTVTRTTAPPPPMAPPVKVESVSTQDRWATKGEPSTLLFLSPQPAARTPAYSSPTNTIDPAKDDNISGRDSTIKKRLFKKKKKVKMTDSVKKLSNRDVRPSVSLDETFINAESDTSPMCDGRKDCTRFTNHTSHHKRIPIENEIMKDKITADRALSSSPLLRTNEPLFTEDEVRARVAETLSAYEKRRDTEEECVLQEVGREIEVQNARYDLLQRETAVVSSERDALRDEVSSLTAQCEALQSNVSALHTELQAEREKSRRAEVQLCHLQDEHRLASSGMQQELSFEKAQWRLAQDEMRRRIDEFAAQLRERTQEWEAQRVALEESEAGRGRLAAELKDRDEGLRRARETAERHEAAAREAQQQTREARAELEGRVTAADGALRQQSDEAKRRGQRVQALEKENTRAAEAVEAAHSTLRDAVERMGTIETALQNIARRASVDTAVAVEEDKGAQVHRHIQNPMSYYNVCFEEGDAAHEDRGGDDSAIALVRSDALREELRDDRNVPRPRKKQSLRPWLPVAASRSRPIHTEKIDKALKAETTGEAEKYGTAIARRHESCVEYIDAIGRVFVQLLQRMSQRRRAEKTECTAAEESARLARLDLQAATERQRCSEARVAVLERERGLLDMQLEASQRDCVELRERAETARVEAEASQQRLRDAESRVSTVEEKLHNAEEKLRSAEEKMRTAEEKAMTRLARVTERVKKSEAEREALRSERDTHSHKVNELLLQVQTLRIHQHQQRGRTALSLKEKETEKEKEKEMTRQKQERESHKAELTTLRKELTALRASRETVASRHAKERAELESSCQSLRNAVDELRGEQTRLQRAASVAEDAAAAQREAEVAALRTLLHILCDAAEPAGETSDVRQRLFDGTPWDSEVQTIAEHSDAGAVDMRHRAVSLAQRAVLELVRLREVAAAAAPAPVARVDFPARANPSACAAGERGCDEWDSGAVEAFQEAERRAWESAQRSAARCHRPPPLLRSAERPHALPRDPPQSPPRRQWQALQQLLHAGTPGQKAVPRSSPSPPLPTSDRRGVSSLSSHSTAGVSRSRSQRGEVDGSRSPARPPVLRALSAH